MAHIFLLFFIVFFIYILSFQKEINEDDLKGSTFVIAIAIIGFVVFFIFKNM